MKILFSPVSGADPVSSGYDGPMLHIVRNELPDRIYLYMSDTMWKNEEKDRRYTEAIKRLGSIVGKDFCVLKIKSDVSGSEDKFDLYLSEFQNKIKEEIFDKVGEDSFKDSGENELIFNVSSGTPAMQSALQFISVSGEAHMRALQVRLNREKVNIKRNDKAYYSLDEEWEDNEEKDKRPPIEDSRCEPSEGARLFGELQKIAIKDHLDNYNYVAALQVAKRMSGASDTAKRLIEAGAHRMELNLKKAQELGYKCGIKDGESAKIAEAFLVMRIKAEQEHYLDFLRGITPIYTAILEKLIKDKTDFDFYKYISYDTDEKCSGPEWYGFVHGVSWNSHRLTDGQVKAIEKIIKDRLNGTGYFHVISEGGLKRKREISRYLLGIMQSIDGQRVNGKAGVDYNVNEVVEEFKYLDSVFARKKKLEFPSTTNYLEIIAYFVGEESDVYETAKIVRNVESAVRNIVAHNLTHVTKYQISEKCMEKESIQEYCKRESKETYEPEDILESMQKLIESAGINLTDEYLKSYDKLNEQIMKELQESA